MLRAVALLLAGLGAGTISVGAQVQSPSQFLHFPVGADRQLADYHQIADYFHYLAAHSPRVQIEDLGGTTQGNPFLMAVISTPENLGQAAHYRDIARRLAHPKGLDAAAVANLAQQGKAIILVTCNIHSNEIASSQEAMELAYEWATSTDPALEQRLRRVILLLVPSLNPDGEIMEVNWYRKYLGTPYEGSSLPWIYNQYTGHDDNRDWYMLTQRETQEMTRAAYKQWYPQVWLDEHQMGSTGPRLFVPPYADPIAPAVSPIMWRGINLIGANMAWRLQEAGKAGVVSHYDFDAYYPGSVDSNPEFKNIFGLITEAASARMATPITLDRSQMSAGAKGLADYTVASNFPDPWPHGETGTWRLRDIMDYEHIATDAMLETVAANPQDFLRGTAAMAQEQIAAGRPDEYWVIPRQQANAEDLAAVLDGNAITVLATPEAFLVPTAQAYGKYAAELLGTQRYPEVRAEAGGPILKPYDITAWSLPLMMGVVCTRQHLPAAATTEARPYVAPPATAPKTTHAVRIGLYKPWTASMDEGWTRFVLDQHGYAPRALDNARVRAGNLQADFDAIILPDIAAGTILAGRHDLPAPYAGGIGPEGAAALAAFVRGGGTLVALAESGALAIQALQLPVRNVLANAKPDEVSIPGSILRVHLASGGEAAVFDDEPIGFEAAPAPPETSVKILARYPADPQDVLLSGWMIGADRLADKAAAIEYRVGRGRVVLFGFRVQYRAQTEGTFPLLFTALDASVQR